MSLVTYARIGKVLALAALGFIINASIFLAAEAGPTVIASLAIVGAFFLVLTLYQPTAKTIFEVDTPFVIGMFLGFTWAAGILWM